MRDEFICAKKTDEGRERHCIEHTSRHTSPEDGDLADARKAPRSSSVEGSCLHLSQKDYFDCQKTKGAGFWPPREAARSFNSLNFFFEIRSGSPLPLYYCLSWLLSMDVGCWGLLPT